MMGFGQAFKGSWKELKGEVIRVKIANVWRKWAAL